MQFVLAFLMIADPVNGIHQVTNSQELYCDDGPPFQVEVFIRSEDCEILFSSDQDLCANCTGHLVGTARQER